VVTKNTNPHSRRKRLTLCFTHPKLENLLLSRPNDVSSVVIADFGLARNSKNARQVFQTQCGTPSYVAPEILLGKAYSPAVDVWSMGVILYTLLIGSFPFAHDDQQSLFKLICAGAMDDQQPEWTTISDEVKDLLKGLLDVDPKKRLTAADALNHTWFTNELDCSSHDLRKSHLRLGTFFGLSQIQHTVYRASLSALMVTLTSNGSTTHITNALFRPITLPVPCVRPDYSDPNPPYSTRVPRD
jgi:serine/threonine protein kinase